MKDLETREQIARRMGGKARHVPPAMRRERSKGKQTSPILLVGRIICGVLMVLGIFVALSGNPAGWVLVTVAFLAFLVTMLTSFF